MSQAPAPATLHPNAVVAVDVVLLTVRTADTVAAAWQVLLVQRDDAAFTARPHVAAGTAKAAEDAWTLGRAVAACGRDIVDALGRWEVGQLALGRQVVARSREAGERLQHGTWTVGEPLPFGLYTVGDSTFNTCA